MGNMQRADRGQHIDKLRIGTWLVLGFPRRAQCHTALRLSLEGQAVEDSDVSARDHEWRFRQINQVADEREL